MDRRLAALAFLGIGLRAVLAPAGAAAFFGLPVPAAEGLPLRAGVRRSRNVGLSVLALTLLGPGRPPRRRGAVFLAAALIAGLDAWIVTTHAGWRRALKHLAYVAGLCRVRPLPRAEGAEATAPADVRGTRGILGPSDAHRVACDRRVRR